MHARAGADLVVLGRVFPAEGTPAFDGGVAATAGRVLVVGERREALAAAGPDTRVVDVGAGSVLPGFRDAHVHLLGMGRGAARADLHGLDLDGLRAAVAARAAATPTGAWIEGSGWSLDSLRLGRPPRAADIAAAAAGRPVLLLSHDFHSALLSPAGMAKLRLDEGDRAAVRGEGVERGHDGRATGLLREAAVFAAAGAAAAAATPADDREAVRSACDALLAAGIVAVDDMDGGRSLAAARALAATEEGPPIRIRAAVREGDLPRVEDGTIAVAAAGPRGVSVTGLKLFLDGALGSRTAWMLDPYDDDPASRGTRTLAPESLEDLIRRAAALGLPCFVHAIGDAAVRAALDALARAPGLPHRIEHAQCVHPDDVPRFRALGVEASVQPGHMATDIPVADRAWGRRGARAFPLRDLLDAGAALRLGSDAPVEPAEPLRWIHAAAERRTPAGDPVGGWWPDQRITREEAVRSAVAAPLAPGAPADLVAWPEDVFAIPAAELLALRPRFVAARGHVVVG